MRSKILMEMLGNASDSSNTVVAIKILEIDGRSVAGAVHEG